MKTITIQIEAKLVWTARQSRSCDRWIVECPALGVSVEAGSKDEISGLIAEALDLLFLDLLEEGQLDQFLRSRNWTKTVSGDDREEDGVSFELPWVLEMGEARGSERVHH